MAYISEFTKYSIGDKVFFIDDEGDRVRRMTVVEINFFVNAKGSRSSYRCEDVHGQRQNFDQDELHAKADEAYREWDRAHTPKVEVLPEPPQVVYVEESRVIDPIAERDNLPEVAA